jgi:hypothetical protein
MTERESSGLTSKSLLLDLLGGDYGAYGLQRERLRRIYSNRLGTNKQPLPPTVSLSGPPGVALVAENNQNNVARGPSYRRNGCKDSTGKVSTLQNIARGS